MPEQKPITRGAYSKSVGRIWKSSSDFKPIEGGVVGIASDPGFVGQTKGTEAVSSIGYFGEGGGRSKNRLYLAYRKNDTVGTSSQPLLPDDDDFPENKKRRDRGDGHRYPQAFTDGVLDTYCTVEDRLYFLSPENSDKYRGNADMFGWPWGTSYSKGEAYFRHLRGGRGGVLIQILNNGFFTKASNFPHNTVINGRCVAKKINGETVANDFETHGMQSGDNYHFSPYKVEPGDYNGHQIGQEGADSVEFFQGKTDEWREDEFKNQWDTVSLGLFTGNADDDCFFGLSGFTCRTVIKIELMLTLGEGGRMEEGFQFGNSEWVANWAIPKESIAASSLTNETEANGYGNHGFILFHPFTGQFIWNNTRGDGYDEKQDFSIDSFPNDIIFWDDNNPFPDCPSPVAAGAVKKSIFMFKQSGENTQGEMDSVVFYDKKVLDT
jgi:hypothetical protein